MRGLLQIRQIPMGSHDPGRGVSFQTQQVAEFVGDYMAQNWSNASTRLMIPSASFTICAALCCCASCSVVSGAVSTAIVPLFDDG